MDVGILVSGEADEAHFSLFFGLVQRLKYASAGIGRLGFIIETDAVNLP